ncbi:SUMO-specific isopeptidase USPL1 [Pangasianodon hypophthalmus]|uniref:SUMO-specific isopeptidase USPL1 n=1 Tax=Pangasianodon hypophthalmus TaxID=310915 RepID=UPI002306FF31|nr:SUMO-specific isopeptidase USPL1 [Pangasianodon hypophthalmus]XP_026797733.3 SUMO-specific isopeptidase USPL1 [Pangasianodon hypophthalmus]XP_034168733.2 SUMO-specific isopeptidase USPL1 [Pangasianodon hypophthalmus]XP_034168734.2 SUMO-specific isopeptidase USPL1 [Pangasianodon hypophthalmus]XP_053097113.1 SUMO-specific isopeptidase USPL1 [Pangasianodon hypophthalmus]
MLMLSSWRGDPANNSEWSEGPMNGEGCDLSVPSPALAGYLGNAENRGVVSGACPWCSAKGERNVLRSYAFNFKESITLCTSPLCLFPLVSGSLDKIRATLSSSQDIQGCKRKFYLTESKPPDPSPKRWKKEDPDIVSDVKCRNVDVGDCRVSDKSIEKGLLSNDHKKQQEVENADKSSEAFHVPSGVSGLSDGAQIKDPVSSSQDKTWEVPPLDETVQDLMQMVPTHQHLFWRNKDNLCWLDSLLVALVHSRILREASCENVFLTDKVPCKNYTVKTLCATYKNSYAYIKAKEQQCHDNIVRVPSDDLHKVEQELEALRMSAFQFLQPKLQCELGQKETPVFALPLLLRSDDWANSLFQHTGQWEFRCTCCGYNFSTSMQRTVTTFTQITADWHPLRAVHRAQCSNCHNKNQKRKLVLQRISSVLALHFVEGLPRRDISKYAFDFHGTNYNITTIIQYNEQREHFVTWIHQQDGLWLEFDDLKYPHCITHRRFTLPASQFHLVFWEADSREESQLPDPLPENTPTQRISKVVDVFQDITNSVPDDTCIVEALTGNKDNNEAASTWNSSIGSTTLLETFEGLSHSDIVALVEGKVDAEENPLPNFQETVTGPAESSVTEAFHLLEKSSFYQTQCSVKNKKGGAKNVSPTPEIILPSVVKASESADCPKVSKCTPALHSANPTASNLSFLFHRHPSHQSTPLRAPLRATHPKVDLSIDSNEALLAKPAELFGGYKTKNSPNPVLPGGYLRHPFVKLPTVPQKPFSCPGGKMPVGPVSTLMKNSSPNFPNSSPSKVVLSTEALRLKLMKRLKAKKKKLAKLNQLLSVEEGESTPRPDSTDISSPYSVTSSTSAYDSPAFDHFFAELLSPAMSTSHLSPDSTGLLEILTTSSQSAETTESSSQENSVPASKLPVPLLNDPSSTNDNFLDELISGSKEQQSVIENAELNALDIFF